MPIVSMNPVPGPAMMERLPDGFSFHNLPLLAKGEQVTSL